MIKKNKPSSKDKRTLDCILKLFYILLLHNILINFVYCVIQKTFAYVKYIENMYKSRYTYKLKLYKQNSNLNIANYGSSVNIFDSS